MIASENTAIFIILTLNLRWIVAFGRHERRTTRAKFPDLDASIKILFSASSPLKKLFNHVNIEIKKTCK